jgi:hypothetical protein
VDWFWKQFILHADRYTRHATQHHICRLPDSLYWGCSPVGPSHLTQNECSNWLTLWSDTTATTANGSCIGHACGVFCVPVLQVVAACVHVRSWCGASIGHFHRWDHWLQNHHRVCISNSAPNISMWHSNVLGRFWRIHQNICVHKRKKISITEAARIATGYGLDAQGVRVQVPVGSRIFFSPCCPDQVWSPPSLLSNGYQGALSQGEKQSRPEPNHFIRAFWISIEYLYRIWGSHSSDCEKHYLLGCRAV